MELVAVLKAWASRIAVPGDLCIAGAVRREVLPGPKILQESIRDLSAPSAGDDLRSNSAIRLRGQTVRSDSFWGIACDFSAVKIRLRLQCILR